MNLAAWISSMGLDLELCGRLCLVLAHSLWQFALLAAVATLIARIWKNATPERIYATYAGALLMGLLALPVTFLLTRLPGETLAMSDAVSTARQAPSQPRKAPTNQKPTSQKPMQQAAPPYMAGNLPEISAEVQLTSAPPAGLLTWAPWLVGCYGVGVLMMLARLIRGLWQNNRLSAQATPITSGTLVETLQALARSWTLRVAPALAMTERVIVPQVVGLWRPVILLPAAALAGLRPDELEMILAHELAHVRRYDLWANLVQRLAEAVLFFNPAVWYLSRRISTYREYCCDEATCRLARRSASDTRVRYAEALLRAVELTQGASHGQKLAALAASGNRPSELRRRVARLLGEPLREPMRVSRTGLVTIAAGIALLLMIPLARQNAAETKEEAKQADSEKKPTVEVVAIGTHDVEPQQWWDAEGKLLENVPFTWTAEPGRVTTDQKLWRRVVIRVNASIANSPSSRSWQIIGARGSAGGVIEFTGGFEPGTYLSRYFSLADGTNTFAIRFGLALGEWQTIAKASGMGAMGSDGKSVVFSEPMKSSDGVDVVVSHNVVDQAYRVIAIDKAGETHESVRGGGSSTSQVSQSRATFPRLALKSLDHFEFQTREYEWTEIKDLPVEQNFVSIQPSEMRVKVVDSDGQPIEGAKVFRNYSFVKPGETNSKIENETYFTDQNGEARVALPGSAKSVRLWVSKEHYAPLCTMWDKKLQTDGDQIPASFEFRMNRGTKIGGIVTNVAGIPIAGAKVEVEDASLYTNETEPIKPKKRPGRINWLAYGDAGVITDAEGHWSLDNVPTDEELVLTDEEAKDPHNTPLRLRFSHPDYETIDGMKDWQEVWNPPLETLRNGTNIIVMKWVDRDDRGRVNAVRLKDGEQYKNADFSGRHFKGQQIIVWNDNMFAGANLAGSTWEDTMVPGMQRLLYDADLSGAKLKNAFFTGRSSGFQETILLGAELESASLMGGGSGFQEANFDGATITNSELSGGVSAFQHASFRETKLHSSRLHGEGAAFQGATFSRARLVKTTISCDHPTAFQKVELGDAEFIECDLSSIDAMSLGSCEFYESTPPRYDAKTKFPAGFDPEEHGWKLIE